MSRGPTLFVRPRRLSPPGPPALGAERLEPRAGLLAVALAMALVMTLPLRSPLWVGVAGLVAGGMALSHLTPGRLAGLLWRLRWLLLTLLLIHGLFTPGTPLPPPLGGVTREGLARGGEQALRLGCMVALAWSLARTTTPWRLVAALGWLGRRPRRWGAPVARGLALLAFTIGRIPRLGSVALGVREALTLRLGPPRGARGRLRRWVLAGEGLLLRLLADVAAQEQALRARGFTALPVPPLALRPWGPGEWSLVALPGVLLLLAWYH